MRRLRFFPAPYPDECYYSIFCRYFARSGSASNKRTIFELFGEAQSLAAFVFLPRRLELLDTWLGSDSPLTREKLALDSSCYAYFSTAFTEQIFEGMEKKIKTGEPNRSLERRIIQKCRRSHWPERMRYCPECVREDIERYGETYWHRMPQLPGIEYCPTHGKPIQDSTVTFRQITMAFCPASHVLHGLAQQEDTEKQEHCQRYLSIARDTEWLLKNGLKLGGCRKIARKYKELFMEKGLATAQGMRHPDRIKTAFTDYHSERFLRQLFPDKENYLYWLDSAFESVSEHLQPLHHILLMEFLKGTVQDFFCSVPDNEPYGNGPWPCINKICCHYGKDGAEKISVTYMNGQTIGHFRCTGCGMKYQRSLPGQDFEKYAGRAVILDYGDYWYRKLRECVEEQGLNQAETAKVMKCTTATVRKRAKEKGLDLYANRKSCIFREKEWKDIDRSRYFRRKVGEALQHHPELTAKELDGLVPGAYAWFHKNDFQWLKERLMVDQDKQYWTVWEQKHLELLKEAYECIRQTGDPDRRITIGWLCSTAGLRECEIKGRLHRFQDIKSFIDEAVESKEEWLSRRLALIAKEKKESGGKMTIADVKKNMGLKPNTYRKYGSYIEVLIQQLNNAE